MVMGRPYPLLTVVALRTTSPPPPTFGRLTEGGEEDTLPTGHPSLRHPLERRLGGSGGHLAASKGRSSHLRSERRACANERRACANERTVRELAPTTQRTASLRQPAVALKDPGMFTPTSGRRPKVARDKEQFLRVPPPPTFGHPAVR
jgi:hypothetical protein